GVEPSRRVAPGRDKQIVVSVGVHVSRGGDLFTKLSKGRVSGQDEIRRGVRLRSSMEHIRPSGTAARDGVVIRADDDVAVGIAVLISRRGHVNTETLSR